MAEYQNKRKLSEIRRRAATVRAHWSPRERTERTGLPPDMPVWLRALLDDRPENSWPPQGVFQLVESRLLPLLLQSGELGIGCE
jgi:hypothetical protein